MIPDKYEGLRRELESAISKAESARESFYSLGKVGDKLVRDLSRDLQTGYEVLKDIKKTNPAMIKAIIRKLL